LEVTPQATGYPGARTLAVVRRQRQPTRENTATEETSYYLSSHAPDEITSEKMGRLIRGHWSAVENNTHWRRDHLMGEDGTRSRQAILIVNLALLRNALLALMADELRGQNQVAFKEQVQRRPALALRLLRSR
jgi:predicted transposase YbfD/YdcC